MKPSEYHGGGGGGGTEKIKFFNRKNVRCLKKNGKLVELALGFTLHKMPPGRWRKTHAG
jgi:hypothetical protein